MEQRLFRVLYTKHLIKKAKTYHDGYLIVHEGGSCVLLDEEKKNLGQGWLAKDVELDPDAEGLSCIEGFLINLDGEVTANECDRAGNWMQRCQGFQQSHLWALKSEPRSWDGGLHEASSHP